MNSIPKDISEDKVEVDRKLLLTVLDDWLG